MAGFLQPQHFQLQNVFLPTLEPFLRVLPLNYHKYLRGVNIFVGLWILQILMCQTKDFKDPHFLSFLQQCQGGHTPYGGSWDPNWGLFLFVAVSTLYSSPSYSQKPFCLLLWNQKVHSCWVGSALSFQVGFSSISKIEAPIGVPGTSIRSVPTLTGEGINTHTHIMEFIKM